MGWPSGLVALFTLACVLCGVGPASAQVVRQLTDQRDREFAQGRSAFDDAGTTLWFRSSSESFGIPPVKNMRVVRWDHASDAGEYRFPFSVTFAPSVSDDGALLVFNATADPTGANPDGSAEVFLVSSDGMTVVQLSDLPSRDVGVSESTLAGSGNRVAFIVTAAGIADELHVVDADGTNLRRLAGGIDGSMTGVAISDDGERIVFSATADPFGTNADGSAEVFVVLADDTGLRQMTSDAESSTFPTIAGDGSQIAFHRRVSDVRHVFALDWAGSDLIQVGPGSTASLTDDGDVLFYTGADAGLEQVQRKNLALGSPPFPLTSDTQTRHFDAVVNGDGTRLAYRTETNYDRAYQLHVMNVEGSDPRTIGEHGPALRVLEPDITADGSRIVYVSNADPLGANAENADQIFRVQADGADRAQVTAVSDALAWHPRITADGENIVFMSYSDLTGADADNGVQKTFSVGADGAGLVQVSAIGGIGEHADVSDDGSTVVLQAFTGLERVDLDGGNRAGFTPSVGGRAHPRVCADGLWVTYLDLQQTFEVWRAATDGSVVEQLTAGPGAGNSGRPVISADGARIAFESTSDPLGTNADGNFEVFVYEVATATWRQLTDTSAGDNIEIAISGNGSWIYFKSDAPHTDASPSGRDLFRVPAAGGPIERVGGLGGGGIAKWGSLRHTAQLESDATGVRVVISLVADWAGGNPDLNQELFLIDYTTAPQLFAPSADPTLLTWEAMAGALDYDVVRGDVADLGVVGGRGAVDLGPVVCIENDSTDNTTTGFEDSVVPESGQAFFYVFRGSQGSLRGPGSWGAGTFGERIVASGSCPD